MRRYDAVRRLHREVTFDCVWLQMQGYGSNASGR
jgi:hypothetical protein